MKYIAHRGSKMYGKKENSYENLKRALEDDRFAGIEFDVRESKDHKLVVIHDAFLDRLTKESGLVKQQTGAHLHDLGFPYLKEILDIESDKVFLIEVKDYDMDVDAFVTLLNAYPTKKIYVFSFSNKIIHEILKRPITFAVGILHYFLNTEHSYQEYDFIALLKGSITEKLLRYFRGKKIEVFVYGILTDSKIKDVSETLLDELYAIVDTV